MHPEFHILLTDYRNETDEWDKYEAISILLQLLQNLGANFSLLLPFLFNIFGGFQAFTSSS